MKDPGPNVLEQQIETNRLLALILAASGGPAPAPVSNPGVSGGGSCQWPTLFSWSDEGVIPFNTDGSAGYDVMISTQDDTTLSHDASISIYIPEGSANWASLSIGPPMGLNKTPRIQLAWMTKQWPHASLITILFEYDNLINKLSAGLQLNENTHNIAYMKTDGTYPPLDTQVYNHKPKDWRKIDFSVNFALQKYSYGSVNDNGYDLSAHDVKSEGSAGSKSFRVEIKLDNHGTEGTTQAYLDEILITDELYTGPPE